MVGATYSGGRPTDTAAKEGHAVCIKYSGGQSWKIGQIEVIMKSLSKEQLASLLTAARAHSERDWLMILVAYNHGLRASEVVPVAYH